MPVGSGSTASSAKISVLQMTKWNQRLSRLLWILFGVLIALEVLIAAVYAAGVTMDLGISLQEYIIRYFIIPCLVIFATVFIAQLFISKIMPAFSVTAQSRFILVTLIIMVSETVALHHGINVIFTLYVLPIVISVIYVNKMTLLMTYVISVLSYLFVYFFYIQVFVPAGEYHHSFIDMVGTLFILTTTYAFSRYTLSRTRELMHTALEESRRGQKLTHELALDSMTQLFNHATFYERLDEFIMQHKLSGQPFALSVMDIDNFKSVNDTYGHDAGNVVLLKLVEIIEQNLEKGDLAFRYGGEEFTILTPNVQGVAGQAERIRTQFGTYDFPGIEGHITVSAGICVYDEIYSGRREFFSAADKALYMAKATGKDRVVMAETPARPDATTLDGW